MTQKIIFIYWPSCAWKSTFIKRLLESSKNMFFVSRDRIKWLISDYDRTNTLHFNTLTSMLISMIKIALNNWLDVIVEWKNDLFLNELRWYLASEKVKIYEINIEATYSVIKERFQQRLVNVEKTWWKLSNTSEDRLLEMYNEYMKFKKKDILTIDTSIFSEEEVFKKGKEYISK